LLIQGALRLSTARYVLHRLFVQRHGWHFKGLAPEGDSWHGTRGRMKQVAKAGMFSA